MNSNEFMTKVDGKDVTFKVNSPSFDNQREAQKIYNRAFSDSVNSGSIIRARLDEIMEEQGLWDEDKQKELIDVQTKINHGEKTLASGGISLDKAKQIAINMRTEREKLKLLLATKNNLDNNTAEGQADNAKFNFLVSCCVVYKDTDKPYFQGYEDFLNKANSTVAIQGSFKLGNIVYGLSEDFEKELPENEFLTSYGFVDNNLNLVDKKGRLVDTEGRLIDAAGRFINESGEYVDIDGNPVNVDGSYTTEFKPFLDESGKPVTLDNKEPEKKPRAKKTKKTTATP